MAGRQKNKLVFKSEIELRESVEILVAGGGPAGMAAAVTAARQGRKVMLIEEMNCLGGMGTSGMLPVFMPFGDKTNFYSGGFGRELLDRLKAAGGVLPDPAWGEECPQLRTETLKRLYDEMAVEEKIKLSLVTKIIAIKKQGNRNISHVVCSGKSRLFAVEAKIFIDCTGDGNLAVWAGAPFEKGDKNGNLMPGTLCSLWAGIDWGKVRKAKQEPEKILLKVLKKYPKIFTKKDPHLPGILENGPSLGGGNVGHLFGVDGTDERTLTPLLLSGRKALTEYEYFYRKFMKGYEKATLVGTAPLTGIRETRRITGDYVLNYNDYAARADFEDGIGRFNYWIDIHPSKASLDNHEELLKYRGTHYKDGESYGIPYRILTPLGLENLLVAGRCVSVDQAVQSSIRVMPGCFITGQAAGMAAALAIEKKTGTRGFPVKELQKRLKKMGAFI
ncbi:MAG: FAD-dependent oxidoreductase [Candidatus Firestonebacteria bacterium]